MTTPYVLIILDGWGHRDESENNAIALGNTPTWDKLWQHQPHSLISASGLDVGLPEGQMGNSEVGHMNLGAGRVVDQDFTRINKSIADGSFRHNDVLLDLMSTLQSSGASLHVFGLLSPGGVHSHEDQITAAIELAYDQGVSNVYLHAFLDGRDVPPKSAGPSLTKIHALMKSHGGGGVATVMGRFYAMDRDQRWDRTEQAFDLLSQGEGQFTAPDGESALTEAYTRGETDEFVKPTAIEVNGKTTTIQDGDAVLFMNFRSDRARQLTRSFINPTFDSFKRRSLPNLSRFVTLTQYAEDIDTPSAFAPSSLDNGLGEYLSGLGKSQLRLAETEKYAHVTFFFSGGCEAPYPKEDRVLVPSPKVATYDLQPSMSAKEVTKALVLAINSGEHDLIVCNYANGDMVGHTGILEAAISAVEYIDDCLQQIVAAIENADGHCLITADHGNVEQMSDLSTGQAHTAHTTELVPLVYVGSKKLVFAEHGTLKDIAPTMLHLMEISKPDQMSGHSLARQTNEAD